MRNKAYKVLTCQPDGVRLSQHLVLSHERCGDVAVFLGVASYLFAQPPDDEDVLLDGQTPEALQNVGQYGPASYGSRGLDGPRMRAHTRPSPAIGMTSFTDIVS